MSILFCTPCYGAQIFSQHFQSCLDTKEVLTNINLEHDWLLMWNESLIQRARNNLVKQFLNTNYERLMFLDADIEFSAEDVSKLWNMNKDIAVGVYPMKRKDAPYAAWVAGAPITNLKEYNKPLKVGYAGTGFMMIKRKVFERLQSKMPGKSHEEGGGSFAWFDPRVEDGVYLSEDYAFCNDARSIGFSFPPRS